MGRIAAQYGDVVYVTSPDNPRTEDPIQIVKDVEVGVGRLSLEELTMKLSLIVGKRFNMLYKMQNLGILYSLQVRCMRLPNLKG